MSRAREEKDEDECFYESLDRILSSASSCSSSSVEDDDDKDSTPNPASPNYALGHPSLPVYRFPMGVSNNYDVWISEPSSVEERRMRLLRQMGLSQDPILSRQRTSTLSASDGGGRGEFGRSVSADHLNRNQQRCEVSCGNYNSCIVHSKSDHHSESYPHDRCNSNSVHFSQKFSLNLISPPVTDSASPHKPPTGKKWTGVEEEIKNDSMSSDRNVNSTSSVSLENPSGGDLNDDLGCYGIVRDNGQVCTIKNLDNGKEFVVNEVREDGMWNKLKEVGTGKQLTMEEFEMCVGHSPIVQELMRRQNVEDGTKDNVDSNVSSSGSGSKSKKKGSWLKSMRNVASSMTGHKERRGSDERDTSSEKGGRRSSSATDDSQDVSFHGPEKVRVRQYGKSCKELTALYKSQEIQAHSGSIWTIKFSLDGKYLASAGEDCVIHVWQVGESERKGDLLTDKPDDGNLNLLFAANWSPERTSMSSNVDNHPEKKRRGRPSIGRKSASLDHFMVPETIFALSEKPICSLEGHLDVVLDLSWSKSQHLLSSSMDKTVRLWHLSSNSCLKIFSHSDYVTCIQFNPVDDRYFISGSLDAKVRIWSIPDRQVVDWSDLREMVTAACYTPDGQGALVGSYKGSCHLYNTSENKLQQKGQINLQNKKKRSHHKKITGFQFAPGSSSEVLITSADSRIRVIDGADLVHKFKGFRNTNSQISASVTANGRYVLCASEDSHVYVWKHEGDSRPSRSKSVMVTQSYEHFHSQDVSVAIPWPGMCNSWEFQDAAACSREENQLGEILDEVSTADHPSTPVEVINGNENSPLVSGCFGSPLHGTISSATNGYFFDRISATWPEERLVWMNKNHSPRLSLDYSNGLSHSRPAWGMVIVTAGLRGEIRTFQNFGSPVRI